MTHRPDRRTLLRTAGAAAVAGALPAAARAQEARRFEPRPGAWRTFEVTTTVSVADVQGAVQVWLPLADVATDWQQPADHAWTGNAANAAIVADPKSGVRMLRAQFAAGTPAPSVSLTSRVNTRDRGGVDWSRPAGAREDASVLRSYLVPTELLPLDGIVRETATKATKGARTDVDKTRAIYDWVVANAHREPKTRGCGTGDIKAMLETGNLGGKCADLNAVFVGLCRSVGVPARDVYGLRLAPSAFGYRELGANPANLKGAQHCRAEAYLVGHGWVAMDPADVLKVMRQETPDWIKDRAHPLAAPVVRGLFGGWEGNWVGWNTGHDVRLPGSAGRNTLPFLMYPNGENATGRFDELAPDAFRYTISSNQVTA
jgi:transglutaminase-like putative cysteine protease